MKNFKSIQVQYLFNYTFKKTLDNKNVNGNHFLNEI